MKKKIGPGLMYARLTLSDFNLICLRSIGSVMPRVIKTEYSAACHFPSGFDQKGFKNRKATSFFLDQIICDYQAHDFIGSLINLAYFGVSHMPFHWIFLTIPITT